MTKQMPVPFPIIKIFISLSHYTIESSQREGGREGGREAAGSDGVITASSNS